MASLVIHAIKGAQAEVAQEQTVQGRVKIIGRLSGLLAKELGTGIGLAPHILHALQVRMRVAVAKTSAAASKTAPYGVVLHPAVPYGPRPRQCIDIYVPSGIYKAAAQQNKQQQLQQQQQLGHQQGQQQHTTAPTNLPAAAPVVFFCHGGVWASGERWHFGPMAVSLAQAGCIVAVISYTLYPQALAAEQAVEVLDGLKWVLQNIQQYGGNARHVTVLGHSAGGHLTALALLMLAQQRHEAALTDGQQHQQWGRRQQQAWLTQSAAEQPQQQQQVQQRQQQNHQQEQQQHAQQQPPSLSGSLAMALPVAFIGMASVYDIGLHYQFEAARGVAGISTMARACGGPAQFPNVSPTVLLKQAAAAAVHRQLMHRAQQQPQLQEQLQILQQAQLHLLQQQQQQQQQQAQPQQQHQLQQQEPLQPAAAQHVRAAGGSKIFGGNSIIISCSCAPASWAANCTPCHPQLFGEVIPLRCGLEAPACACVVLGAACGPQCSSSTASSSGVSQNSSSSPLQQDSSNVPAACSSGSRSTSNRQCNNSGHSSNRSSSSQQQLSRDGANSALTSFTPAAAAHLPPFILMSSCADHMVPWPEACDMLIALQSCGVPAKHLIYDRHLHNDFVLDWRPECYAEQQDQHQRSAAADTAVSAVEVASKAAAGGGVTNRSGEYMGVRTVPVPAFAQDLVKIVTGAIAVHYIPSGSSSRCCSGAATGVVLLAAGSQQQLSFVQSMAVPQPQPRL